MAEFLINTLKGNQFDDGQIIVARSDTDITIMWAEMLIRGTHNYDIAFNVDLYKKYYIRRVRDTKTGQIISETDTVTQTQRQHQAGLSKRYVAIDVMKDKDMIKKMYTDIANVKKDIKDVFGTNPKWSVYSDRSIISNMMWGQECLKKFMVVYIPDSEFISHDEIREKEQLARDEFTSLPKSKVLYATTAKSALKLDATMNDEWSGLDTRLKTFLDNQNTSAGMSKADTFYDILKNGNAQLPPIYTIGLTKSIITEGAALGDGG